MVHHCTKCGAFNWFDNGVAAAELTCGECGHVEAQNPHGEDQAAPWGEVAPKAKRAPRAKKTAKRKAPVDETEPPWKPDSGPDADAH